jgi:uncharacterized protein involved in exopolysaccharide biosynthesis
MQGQVLDTSNGAWDEGPSLLESVWRFRWLVLAAMLLGTLAGYGLSIRQPPKYEAAVRIFLAAPGQRSTPGAASGPLMDADRYVRNQAQIMTSWPVISRAARVSGLPAQVWRPGLTVTPSKDLDLIVIQVRTGNAADAARLADSVADAYQYVVAKQARDENAAMRARLKTIIDRLSAELDDVKAKLLERPENSILKSHRAPRGRSSTKPAG